MFRYVEETMDMLDDPSVDGDTVASEVRTDGVSVETNTISSNEGSTDFVQIRIPGEHSNSPTLGVIGRLGGLGARPSELGLVSDADGAIVAIATALKLRDMYERGDQLFGDVIISTHVCPDAPTQPHDPVPFMGSPVDIQTMNQNEVSDDMDAILSIDATKGNRVHTQRGFAITPTVKEGWLLNPSNDLLHVQERVTGEPPSTLTVTPQDITPYGNGVHHINSILQPATATNSPVVGVATTSVSPIAGSGTGANYVPDLASASSFVIETAKDYLRGRAKFFDSEEFDRLQSLYGSMEHLVTKEDSE